MSGDQWFFIIVLILLLMAMGGGGSRRPRGGRLMRGPKYPPQARVVSDPFASRSENPDSAQHVHCDGDGDGLCCGRHMDGNPTQTVHSPDRTSDDR